jgi:hypothetical protein
MHEAGVRAFAARDAANSKRYSFEEKPSKLDPASLTAFQGNQRAWKFFKAQAPWYQRTSIFWVMDAKREETRARRLAELIGRSAQGEPIKLLDRRPAPSPGSGTTLGAADRVCGETGKLRERAGDYRALE